MWVLYFLLVITLIFMVYKKRPDFLWDEKYDEVNIPGAAATIIVCLLAPISLPIYLFWRLLDFIYNKITKEKQ